jgi:hypothetical protein
MKKNVAEVWKAIKGYEGHYEVSNLGRVRSLDRTITTVRGPRVKRGRIIKFQLAGRGYPKVELQLVGCVQTVYIHQLVAYAFVGVRPSGWEINHKDGNKLNNCSSNLEYLTRSNNQKHANDIGLKSDRGEGNAVSVLKNEDVLEIRRLVGLGHTQVSVAKKFGVSFQHVSDIHRRLCWKHI